MDFPCEIGKIFVSIAQITEEFYWNPFLCHAVPDTWHAYRFRSFFWQVEQTLLKRNALYCLPPGNIILFIFCYFGYLVIFPTRKHAYLQIFILKCYSFQWFMFTQQQTDKNIKFAYTCQKLNGISKRLLSFYLLFLLFNSNTFWSNCHSLLIQQISEGGKSRYEKKTMYPYHEWPRSRTRRSLQQGLKRKLNDRAASRLWKQLFVFGKSYKKKWDIIIKVQTIIVPTLRWNFGFRILRIWVGEVSFFYSILLRFILILHFMLLYPLRIPKIKFWVRGGSF